MASPSTARGAFLGGPRKSLGRLLSRMVSAIAGVVIGGVLGLTGAILLLTGVLLAQQALDSSRSLPSALTQAFGFLARTFALLARAEPAG